MDVLTKEQRSYNMSQIRGKNTGPELILRKSLSKMGFRYRIHYKLPGKPDVVFVNRRIAIFVDGCFWHGCPVHGAHPKTNTAFWEKKIQSAVDRDCKNRVLLEQDGWTVLHFWEHDIKENLGGLIDKILDLLNK